MVAFSLFSDDATFSVYVHLTCFLNMQSFFYGITVFYLLFPFSIAVSKALFGNAEEVCMQRRNAHLQIRTPQTRAVIVACGNAGFLLHCTL